MMAIDRYLSNRLTFCRTRPIVKHVLNQPEDIDRILQALADPTRRRIVERLGDGPASVTTLAAPLPMSLPAVVQHLQVLENSGLIASQKVGRVRTCRLDLDRLSSVEDWIDARRRSWARRLDRLGDVLAAEATSDLTTAPQSKESTP
jgi:DNA-binding transcriptional ArsR family regulator